MNNLNTIQLGYTLTDCYQANANFNGQQKQFVIKYNENLLNVKVGGYVNAPSDSDRGQEFIKLADLSAPDFETLKTIGIDTKYKHIDFNHLGQWMFTRNLSKKQSKDVNQITSKAFEQVNNICAPYNAKCDKAILKAIKKVLKPYLKANEYKQLDKYIYLF